MAPGSRYIFDFKKYSFIIIRRERNLLPIKMQINYEPQSTWGHVATCSDIEASFNRQQGKLYYIKCFMSVKTHSIVFATFCSNKWSFLLSSFGDISRHPRPNIE